MSYQVQYHCGNGLALLGTNNQRLSPLPSLGTRPSVCGPGDLRTPDKNPLEIYSIVLPLFTLLIFFIIKKNKAKTSYIFILFSSIIIFICWLRFQGFQASYLREPVYLLSP